ncbi:MAG: carboxypeptidase regulatory-like domain-containing protein [Gemmatimonadota bacterium]
MHDVLYTMLNLHRRGLVLALLLPFSLRAQTIRGTVTDRASTPVSGAVAQLLDSTSRVVARQLTNDQGSFRLVAPSVGTYRIQALRIGYQPTLSDARVLRAGDDVTERIVLNGIQVSFDTIRVVGQSSCRVAKDTAAATFAIWQQVRTALTAADITTGDQAIATTAVVYERKLDVNARNVLAHASVLRSGTAAQPWLSLTPDSLSQVGYVATDTSGATTYYAPGLDVLLSSRFLEDHCLRTFAAGTLIGMEFEPTRDRKDIPEIRGTVWLDRATLALSNMEYKYANIPELQARAGGTMEFARLRGGAWAISRWNIVMPELELRTLGIAIGRVDNRHREAFVKDIVERGGELVLARRANDTLYSRPSMSFRGQVRDSASRAPAPGAYVAVEGTTLAGIADSVGRFSIAGLIPGEYIVDVHTPSLDSVGASHRVRVSLADSATRVIDVPTAEMFTSRVCGTTRKSGALAGIVVGGVKPRVDSLPVAALPVVAEWLGADSTVQRTATRTDSVGAFRLCGVPLDVVVSLTAESRGEASEPIAVRLPSDRLLASVELMIDVPRGATLAGLVRGDSLSGLRPVANAEVMLLDVAKTVTTNEQGQFQLVGIPPGEHRLVVRRIGYTPVDVPLSFAANERITRNIDLSRVTTLDSVRIVEQARALRTFEDHRKLGLGHFFDRDELAKKEGRTMAALMSDILGVKVVRPPVGSAAYVSTTRRPPSLGQGKSCYSRVYLDNVMIYGNRDGEPLFDINSISPDQIEAIEVYSSPSQIPNMYAGLNTDCGVLVIWRRRSFL